MDNTNITPQGYTYAIEPNTIHPFWKSGGDSNYIYADLKNPVIFENTDRNFTRFDAVLQGAVPFIAPLTLALVSVTINSEVALPFVGVMHGDIAFLICEGIETNRLKVVGVYASSDMSDLEIKNIVSIPAPIKGDKGDNGQDGVTPEITASASVDQTTGTATVNVTKTGTNTNPAFNFAFTGLKGERGEQGQAGAKGEKGDTGATGATGATPDITINATVDETTGTPAVAVNKSGTLENPVFDLAFSGLKGEGGSGGSWQTLQTTDGNIKNIMSQLKAQNATKVLLDNLNISGFHSGLYFNIRYVDDSGTIQTLSRSYSTVTISHSLHEVIAENINNKWICTGKFLLGSGGTILTINDGTQDNRIVLYYPKFVVSTNNLGVDNDIQLVLSLVGYSSAYIAINGGYSGSGVLSVNYSGGFFVENTGDRSVSYM